MAELNSGFVHIGGYTKEKLSHVSLVQSIRLSLKFTSDVTPKQNRTKQNKNNKTKIKQNKQKQQQNKQTNKKASNGSFVLENKTFPNIHIMRSNHREKSEFVRYILFLYPEKISHSY